MRLRPLLALLVLAATSSAAADPAPAATKTPSRLEQLLITPTPAPSPSPAATKSTKRVESLLLDEKRPEICTSLETLTEAARNEFSSVHTGEGKRSLSTVTPPGATDRCSIVRGATGLFVNCEMKNALPKADAEKAYRELVTSVKACFAEWTPSELEDDSTGERQSDFGEDRSGILGAVEVRTTIASIAKSLYDVEIRVHER